MNSLLPASSISVRPVMKTRVRIIALNFAVLIFVFFVMFRSPAPYGISGSAQDKKQEKKETTTTVVNKKYGEGGTVETTSDANLKLLSEVWKDKDGKIKEEHNFRYTDDGKLLGETWRFSTDAASPAKFYSKTPHITRPKGKL